MQEIRSLICFIVFAFCIVLSFKGFPLGIASFIGFVMVLSGWTAAISAMFHPMGSKSSRRLITIIIGFFIASLGRATVDWAGLASISLGTLVIDIPQLAAYTGILSGIFNIDKSMQPGDNILTSKNIER
jgi:hypothetical protein